MIRSWPLCVAALLFAADASARDSAETDECIRAAEEAQPLRAAGKLHAAREKLVVCARGTCPTAVRSDCTEWLVELDRERPSIVVRAVTAAGEDLVDVRVLVDGAVVADRLDGAAIQVDPGVHSIRFERRGTTPIEEQLVVRQGEQSRVVSVAYPAPPVPRAPRPGIPAASWALGGVGAAAFSVAGVLWISGHTDRSDLAASCAPARACAQSDVDDARTKLIAGDVALGVGLVALGAAAWLWISATRTPVRSAAVHVFRF